LPRCSKLGAASSLSRPTLSHPQSFAYTSWWDSIRVCVLDSYSIRVCVAKGTRVGTNL
jgi:hypothetical protein